MRGNHKPVTYSEKVTVRVTKEMFDAMMDISIRDDKPLARVLREFAERGFDGEKSR